MPNRSFVVQYLIKAKDAFSKNAAKVAKSSKLMAKQTEKAAKGFNKADKAAKKAGVSVKKSSLSFSQAAKRFAPAAAIVTGLAFALSKVVSQGRQFETAMADLSAITGATGKDLSSLSDEAIRLAKSAIVGSDEVATAFKLVASAKPELLENTKALAKVTEQVLLLANASGIDLSSASEITAQGLNIFGASANQASRFVNVLAAGAKFGASEIAETGEAMLIAGPAARAAGLSFEQLNAAIQVTALGGIKASRAGTALNAILGRMRRQGIDFKKVGLQGGFELIKKSLDAIKDPTKRAIAESKIFGEEHSKVGLAILANVKMLDKFKRKLTGTSTAQEQANIRLNTGAKRGEKLGIVINTKLIAAYKAIEGPINRITESTIRLFDALDPEAINILVSPFKLLGAVLSGLLDILIGVFAIFKGIVQTVAQLVAAIATLDFGGFDFLKNFSIGGELLGVKGIGDLFGAGKSETDVNLNVGLTSGLEQKGGASVSQKGRPANVGLNAAGA